MVVRGDVTEGMGKKIKIKKIIRNKNNDSPMENFAEGLNDDLIE